MPSLPWKKKDKYKDRDADLGLSLSDVSQINGSSTSISTEATHALSPAQQEKLRKDKKKEKDRERKNDNIELALSGTSVVLGLVNEAAQFAPVPILQNAASLALTIVTIVQAVKESDRQYKLLAIDATSFIASIWRSYQQSAHKQSWLSPDLQQVIVELVVTLDEITKFVDDKKDRKMLTKIFGSNADPAQVTEYRERIKSAVKKFELFSHLKLNEMLLQVFNQQQEIKQSLMLKGIEVGSPSEHLLLALRKSPSGFPMDTMGASTPSLNTLSSSVMSSPLSSAATSPGATHHQPASFIVEGTPSHPPSQAQSPQLVVTPLPVEAQPPANYTGTASSPQPSQLSSNTQSPPPHQPPSSTPSPTVASTLSSPSSLPSSPSFTETSSIAGTLTSPTLTLVGSPESEHLGLGSSAGGTSALWPSEDYNSQNSNNHITNHHPNSNHAQAQRHEAQPEDEDDDNSVNNHHINILVDDTHAPMTRDATADEVRKGRRMPTSAGNAILKGVVTVSPSGTASESESIGRSPTPSDTETAVSDDRNVISAAERLMEKERMLFGDDADADGGGSRNANNREDQRQRPSDKRQARRTDTEATLTSERQDTLKSPPPQRRERRQTVLEEDEEDENVRRPRYDSPARDEPRKPKRKPEPRDTYDDDVEMYDDEPAQPSSRPARGPTRKPGPKRNDSERVRRSRGDEEYDDQWEEDEEEEVRPRRSQGNAKGKGKAPQRNQRATVEDEDEDDEDNAAYERDERGEDASGSVGFGNEQLKRYITDVRKKTAAAVSGRVASNAATGSAARKNAAASVGKDEKLSIKFSKIKIDGQRRQQQQQQYRDDEPEEEDDEEEQEEEEYVAPKKRRPKRPPTQQNDPFNGYAPRTQHHSYGPPPPDPYYGGYPPPGQYGYHHPPPHPGYYSPPSPPQPRYGPGALGFIPGLGPGYGSNANVTMTNVGNDNSVRIVTTSKKSSKRRQG